MDSMDRSILKCLSENSRRSATDISQAVHLSVAAVIERIRKMERKGIIQQYTIVADQHKLGNDVTALMEVSLEHPKYYDEFTKVMADNESIVACDYLTGDYDFMLLIHAESMESYHSFTRRVLTGEYHVRTYKRLFVMNFTKAESGILL